MPSLLNRKATRDFILQTVRQRRAWKCSRVSKEALDHLEFELRQRIRELVHQHPSAGQTFRP